MKRKEVVVVVDDKVLRIPYRVWSLFVRCAGQMIQDGDHMDAYKDKGIETKRDLDAVSEFYRHCA